MPEAGSQPREATGLLCWPEKAEEPKPGELDEQQYHTALGAHRLFAEMAERWYEPARPPSKRPELDHFLPSLDEYRSNHAVLIDGARGAGKTGVMLRLVHDWSELLRQNTIPNLPTAVSSKSDRNFEIVPVGLLDLEAVPQTANLATRIAGLFERVVSAMERRGSKDERPLPAWASLENDTLNSRQKWERFVNAAALEWDRSLERRRANIDPEAYAVEVQQAESKGMHARDSFREFVDALVTDWETWSPRRKVQPFFVVPIDDADLNPGRVVELFGLLRTLWHPRVGYLLTGYSDLFMRVLTTHFRWQIDMPQLAGPVMGNEARFQVVPDLDRAAERLARDYYQKAVSLENCRELGLLDGKVRVEFLRPFLQQRGWDDLTKFVDVDAFAREALPGRWRKLKDLRDWVRFDHNLTPAAFVLRLWNDALDDSTMVGSDLDNMRALVRVDADRLNFEHWKAPRDDARFVAWVSRRAQKGFAEVTSCFGHKLRAWLGGADSWSDESHVCTGTSRSSHAQNVRVLDEAVAAAYVLMSNVAELPPVAPIVAWSHCRLKGTSVEKHVPYGLRLVWPVPGSSRHYEKQILIRDWNALAPGIHGNPDELGRLLLTIVASAWRLLDGNVNGWESLARAVVDRFDVSNVNDGYPDGTVARWCVHAALLAAPEWGLTAQGANTWLELLKKEAERVGKWERLRESLGSYRTMAINGALVRASRYNDNKLSWDSDTSGEDFDPADENLPPPDAGQEAASEREQGETRMKVAAKICAEVDKRASEYVWSKTVQAESATASPKPSEGEASN